MEEKYFALMFLLFIIIIEVDGKRGPLDQYFSKKSLRKNSSQRTHLSKNFEHEQLLDNGIMLPSFPKKVDNVTVTIGQNAELQCEVEDLNNYKVAWVRVDTQTILTIHNNVITRNPRISLSRPSSKKWFLHIQRTQESDRGWYMCQINTDPMVHRSGYLEVVVPPKILTRDIETDIVVREGENLTLTCNAEGHPRPQIIWKRDDGSKIVLNNGEKTEIVENRHLQLTKVSRLHMGDYLCVASNGIAPSTKKMYKIKVQFPPMFWIPNQLERAYVGQDVTLECHSEAFPKSINYWVKQDGQMLISNRKYETLIVDSGYKVYMKLRIRNVTSADFMQYKCVSKNSLGGTDGSITLYEVDPPTTIPATTKSTTVTTSTPTTTLYHVTGRRQTKSQSKKGKKHHRRKHNQRNQEKRNQSNHITLSIDETGIKNGRIFTEFTESRTKAQNCGITGKISNMLISIILCISMSSVYVIA